MSVQEQYDQIVNEHFMYEATDDIEGVMASLADRVEHHVVPTPVGILQDKDAIRGYYEMLFGDVKGESVTPVRRLYGDGFVVDEALWHGHIADGRAFLLDGKGGDVSFRMLHVFEIADGKISRENVWCDLAAIQQQLASAGN
jgi:ketosteroid isomerase-like protein